MDGSESETMEDTIRPTDVPRRVDRCRGWRKPGGHGEIEKPFRSGRIDGESGEGTSNELVCLGVAVPVSGKIKLTRGRFQEAGSCFSEMAERIEEVYGQIEQLHRRLTIPWRTHHRARKGGGEALDNGRCRSSLSATMLHF